MADNNQMREILEKLDEGVKSLFESDKYAEYLSVMSRFHNYSTRNTLLIYAQKPDAQRVAGFRSWKHNFNRQVKKGEHGIKILAPLPFAETKEFEKLDPETKQPILDEHGQPVMETLMRMGARFKTVSVFDISQTVGEPLPELAETLTGDVERYELFMDTLRAVSPLPIVFEPMKDDQDGYCKFGDKIAIREGMSEVQTISAIIHEITHAVADEQSKIEPELADNSEQTTKPRSRRDDEIIAESVSYVVCQKFGIETGANSFGYVSSWSKTSELKELHASLDVIRKTAAGMIDGIEEKYRALAKERGIDLSAPVPQRAVEVSIEQNYNMIDGVINNESDKPEQTVDEPQTDLIRERLAAMSQAETPEAKYETAFSTLVEALCANEELLAVAATGEGWQKGAGRKVLFDGGYFETLLDTYSAELADLLADNSYGNRLRNTVRGEAYRRLDAIAYDRFILDECADITKSGRLETYDQRDAGPNERILVGLTEQLSDGGVHDYGAIFGYDPDDRNDHAINNYLSLKSFAGLRESVFGKYKAIIYIRLSSADDKTGASESDSVTNQRKLINEWLKNHPEIEVVAEKVDDGWSGILFDRPAFKEMMEEIEAGRVNCILCKDLSRLGREYIETGRYLRRVFPAYGVRFVAINDNIDTLNDSGDDLTVSLKSIMNDAYCRDTSIKTRSALESKRKSGDYVGAFCVYGYRKSEENRNQLVPDEYASKIVRDIFDMKLGGYSSVRIADSLNALGILSPYQYKKDRGLPHPKNNYCDKDGTKWSAHTIIRILQDETYTGTLVQGKTATPNYKLKELQHKPESEWHKCENAHQAIVSRANFELVQRLLRLDTRTAPDGDSVYVFSGLLICGCCGNRMIRKSAPGNGKRYYNYWCPTTKKGGCTSSGMMKEDVLLSCVLESVKAHIANVASLETLITKLDADSFGRELAAKLAEQVAENEHRLKKISEFKAGLFENMMDGSLTKEEHKALKAKYTADADVLIAANERLGREIDDALSCKHERLMWMEHFKQFANLETLDRKAVAILIKCIRIKSKREIEIEFNYGAEYEAAFELIGWGVA